MLTYNNDSLFTGYLKQLLSEFNLPTYRIYTKAHKRYFEKNGVESPEILATVPINNITYKNIPRYVKYIKDDEIAEYMLVETATTTSSLQTNTNTDISYVWKHIDDYYENKKFLNGTKNLKIKNNIYDTYTHEYLGEYLRFMRDYYDINLMPLYNCFSNKICNNLLIEKSNFIFNSSDNKYKIYMLPVKLFKKYTIAIDSDTPIEICCGIFGKYYDKSLDAYNDFPTKTYKKYQQMHFNNPVVYDKLSSIITTLPTGTGDKDVSNLEIASRESDLKMFIKIPADNLSSITILEGDYSAYNRAINKFPIITTDGTNSTVALTHIQNHAITNFEYNNKIVSLADYSENYFFDLPTSLQLLSLNTGKSYPFSDKLIEYLIGNVIMPDDPSQDNIKRVQTVVAAATENRIVGPSGLWDPRLRPIMYAHMQNNKDTYNINTDILGYVDKDVEQQFSTYMYSSETQQYERVSIANVDIYPELYRESK